MNREQPNGVCPLLLRDGLQLFRADGLLFPNETHEPFEVRPAELLVRPREPRQLAEIRVAALAVPLRQRGEVVIVFDDDLLAQALERQPRRLRGQPLVPLLERADEPRVGRVELRRNLALDPDEERPPAAGAPDQDERVVGDADERRGEDGDERLVVVAVLKQPEVSE
jgi:hypothetical protein